MSRSISPSDCFKVIDGKQVLIFIYVGCVVILSEAKNPAAFNCLKSFAALRMTTLIATASPPDKSPYYPAVSIKLGNV